MATLVACSHHDGDSQASSLEVKSFAALQTTFVQAQCATCHGGTSPAAGIDLSNYESLMASGAVKKGNSAVSSFYTSISSNRMPPGKELSPEIIEDVRRWIEDGAKKNGTPVISKLTPATGIPGALTLVQISGSNFDPLSSVLFGKKAAVSIRFKGENLLEVTAPAMTPGKVSVSITNPDDATVTVKEAFDVSGSSSTRLSVNLVSPNSGPGNTVIKITGSGFVTASAVMIGTQPCTATAVNPPNEITCTVPPVTYSAKATVTVTNPDSSTFPLINGFRYAIDASYTHILATIFNDVNKCAGCHTAATAVAKGGGFVFSGASTIAQYNTTLGLGMVIPCDVDNSPLYQYVLPGHSPQEPRTKAPLADAEITEIRNWIANCAPPDLPPIVNSIAASSGTTSGGISVFILGSGFLPGLTVNIGTSACSSPSVNLAGTRIDCVTGPATAGVKDVFVINPDPSGAHQLPGVKVNAFTYIADPIITSLSPASVPSSYVGNITISGTNFATSGGVNFKFGNVLSNTVIPSCVGINCTAVVPFPVQAAGHLIVQVTNFSASQSTNYDGFDVTSGTAPVITSLSIAGSLPAAGVVPSSPFFYTGTTPVITANGTGFINGATVMLGGQAATAVTFVSSIKITFKPASNNLTVGNTSPVIVSNPDLLTGSSTIVVRDSINVATLSPTFLPVITGGGTVNLSGKGFLPGLAVTVGGVPCGSVQFVNSTSVNCNNTPNATVASNVNIVATNVADENGNTHASTPISFSYTMIMTSIAPAVGTSAGGDSVTITGNGFSGSTVTIGGVACTNPVVTQTSITCTTGAHAAGPPAVDVVVTNANTISGTLAAGFTYQ